jgi:hypothetical protein
MPVRYRLSTGPGTWTSPFTGVLDLAAPTVTDYGGGEVGFHYGVTGSFAVGGVTYMIAGTFLVHDQGAGLWDASFSIPVSASNGGSFHWESTTGTFFRADGLPYPLGQGPASHAYGVHPEKIHFLYSGFLQSSGLGIGTLIAEQMCASPSLDDAHLKSLDKKITDLSNALATLGRGTDLRELLQVIRNPGWTTPAEFAFCMGMLDGMQAHAKALGDLSSRLLASSKLVAPAR